MKPSEIKKELERRHPFLLEKWVQTQNVALKISHFIHGVASEYDESKMAVISYLNPLPETFFDKSFPYRSYKSLVSKVPAATEICQLVSDLSWKQTGKGEILLAMLGGLRRDSNNRGDGYIGNKKYNVKNLASAACLKSRPNQDRDSVHVDRLIDVYFDGNRFGHKKTHMLALDIAKEKGLKRVTDFFEELYAPRFTRKECENISTELLQGMTPYEFNQLVGSRIHLEDARIDDVDGYILVTDTGIIHLLRDDIIEYATSWGLKYSVHLRRGSDTNSVPDGYATVSYKKLAQSA